MYNWWQLANEGQSQCVRADQQQIKNFAKEHNGIELFDIEEAPFTLHWWTRCIICICSTVRTWWSHRRRNVVQFVNNCSRFYCVLLVRLFTDYRSSDRGLLFTNRGLLCSEREISITAATVPWYCSTVLTTDDDDGNLVIKYHTYAVHFLRPLTSERSWRFPGTRLWPRPRSPPARSEPFCLKQI